MKMKKSIITATALITVSLKTYAAVPVVDFEAITNLANQLVQIQNQVSMMKQNLVNLGQYNWNDIKGYRKDTR